jgi:hypothetical protein
MTVILGNASCKRVYFLLLTPEQLQVVCVHNGDDNQLSSFFLPTYFSWGHAVASLVEALCHKPDGRWFDSR